MPASVRDTVRSPARSPGASSSRAGRRPKNDFPAVALPAGRPFDGIHRLYLTLEPELLEAIGRGDRREARRIINHLLVHIYSLGEERSDLLKGLLLELVVMLSRAAVAAGASQTEMLGQGYRHLTELARIEDDEALAAWLRAMLERIFTAADGGRSGRVPAVVTRALRCMRAELGRAELSREEVARAAGASPGHLSELLKEHTGRPFVDLLRELRIEHACRLLSDGDEPIAGVALASGFCDQSYFSRVFRESRGMTPRRYREAARDSAGNGAPDPRNR